MSKDKNKSGDPGLAATGRKPCYETPAIIPLGELVVGFGAGCENGSGPPQGGQCSGGSSATGNKCETGGAAGNKCESGSSTGGKCETGTYAGHKCATGGNQR